MEELIKIPRTILLYSFLPVPFFWYTSSKTVHDNELRKLLTHDGKVRIELPCSWTRMLAASLQKKHINISMSIIGVKILKIQYQTYIYWITHYYCRLTYIFSSVLIFPSPTFLSRAWQKTGLLGDNRKQVIYVSVGSNTLAHLFSFLSF